MQDEYISVKEFAKRAGVSVQSLYKRLNGLNNPLNQYIKLVDNQKMLNISALEEVYGIEVEQPIQPNHSTYSTFYSTSAQENETVIDILLKQSEMLKKELEMKNEQIIFLQEENRKLRGELMTLSEKMGDVLQNITKTQLADKILEGQEVQKEREEVGESRGFFAKIFGK